MYQISLFKSIINVKSEHCTKNNSLEIAKIEEPYVNLYVKLQNHCNAHCKFCEFRGEQIDFNLKKFNIVLEMIRQKVKINKISFTGGEPTFNIPLLYQVVNLVKKIDNKIFIVINTNGVNIERLAGINVNSIAMSRHHYSDDINNQILGFEAPSKETIRSMSKIINLHLSCNLIKDYIDSEEEVIKYLEFCGEVGVKDVGLVSLMKVNGYCKEHHIDFNNFDFSKYNNIMRNRVWNNKDYCRCANYLYSSPNHDDIIKMYSRYYVKQNNIESQLVFDGKNLKDGFNGKIII